MARTYDSSRRAALSQKTREAILEAAFRLHGLGVLDTETLAREANVSVATVRKHFPTREALFEGCTAWGIRLAPMPNLAALAAIADPAERTREAVRQVYTLHEALAGQVWGAFKLEDESPAMAGSLLQLDQLVGAVTQLLAAPESDDGGQPGFIAGMLSPLTFRALRVTGGLSAAEAVARVTGVLLPAPRPAPGSEKAVSGDR